MHARARAKCTNVHNAAGPATARRGTCLALVSPVVDPVKKPARRIQQRTETEPSPKPKKLEAQKPIDQTQRTDEVKRQEQASKNLAQPSPSTTSAVTTNGDGKTPVDPAQRQSELQSTVPGKDEVLPERKQAIETFLAGGGKPIDALRNQSPLGAMSDAERTLVIDQTIDRLAPADGKTLDKGALDALAFHASKDPQLAAKVSERMVNRALELRECGVSPITVETLASTGLIANPSPTAARAVLEKLGPERSAALFDSLNLGKNAFTASLPTVPEGAKVDYRTAAANLLIRGAALGAPTPASAALLDRAVVSLPPAAFETQWGGKQLGENLGQALARHWYTDPAAQQQHAERLSGILGSEAGRELIAHPSLSPAARLERLQLLAKHPEWSAESFRSASSLSEVHPYLEEIAKPKSDRLAQLRGTTPVALQGTDLENTVGFSMNFPPKAPPANETPEARAQREQAMARGEYDAYADTPGAEHIAKVTSAIRAAGGEPPEVTVLNVQFTSKQEGIVDLPLYRVKNPEGDRFVDNLGRTYSSFEDWKTSNKLDSGTMTYPKNGEAKSPPELESAATPRTVDTTGEYVREGANYAALIGGTVAGVAIIAGSGGTLAPIVATGAGLYGAYNGAESLYDRSTHGQSINPLTSSEARSEWVNVAAGTLSGVGGGASSLAARLTTQGSKYSSAASTAASFFNTGALVADTAAATDAGVTLARNWDKLSTGERLQLGLSVGFWGVSAANSTRGLKTRPFDAPEQRKAQIEATLAPEAQAALVKNGAARPELYELAGSTSFRHLRPEEQTRAIEAFSSMPEPVRQQALGDLNAAQDRPALQLALLERMRDPSFLQMKPEVRQSSIDALKQDPRLGEVYTPSASRSWQSMTPVERQRFFLSEHPEAHGLTRLSPEKFEETFGAGPYPDSLGRLGAHRRFVDAAIDDPETARGLLRASQQIDVAKYLGDNPGLSARRALTGLEPLLPQTSVIDSQGVNYALQTHPAGSSQPAFRLTPLQDLDHNGAFSVLAKMPNGKYESTGLPREVQYTGAHQIQLPDGTQATPKDWDRIAVFAGHGGTDGFQGLTTKQAANMMADQLVAAKKQGRTIDYVLLESCSQGTGRGLLGRGKTNAQAFQEELDAALKNKGLGPVTVLAAKQAGVTYNGTHVQTTTGALMPGFIRSRTPSWLQASRPIDFVSADQQPGGLSPVQKRNLLLLGGGTGLSFLGGGAVVYTAVELTRDERTLQPTGTR